MEPNQCLATATATVTVPGSARIVAGPLFAILGPGKFHLGRGGDDPRARLGRDLRSDLRLLGVQERLRAHEVDALTDRPTCSSSVAPGSRLVVDIEV